MHAAAVLKAAATRRIACNLIAGYSGSPVAGRFRLQQARPTGGIGLRISTATFPCLKPRPRFKKKSRQPTTIDKNWRDKKIQILKAQLGELDDIPIADLEPTPTVNPSLQGPNKQCIPYDEATKIRIELADELFSMEDNLKKKDPAAWERIQSDERLIRSGRWVTQLEFAEALWQVAKQMDSPRVSGLLTLRSKRKFSNFYDLYKKERAKVPAELLERMDEELQIHVENTLRDETRFSRFKKSVLDQVHPHERSKYYKRHADLLFQQVVGEFSVGLGSSMLPTLPMEKSNTFSLQINDDARSMEDKQEKEYGEGIFMKPHEITKAHMVLMYMKRKKAVFHELMPDIRLRSVKTNEIKKGDIVNFVVRKDETSAGQLVCKRVAGLQNDKVLFQGRPYYVAPGHFWALGDNSRTSLDSRHYGAIPLANLRGKLICSFRFWPPHFIWFRY